MKKFIGKIIWDITEYFNISLGKLDPIIFGWMIGSKPIKVDKK